MRICSCIYIFSARLNQHGEEGGGGGARWSWSLSEYTGWYPCTTPVAWDDTNNTLGSQSCASSSFRCPIEHTADQGRVYSGRSRLIRTASTIWTHSRQATIHCMLWRILQVMENSTDLPEQNKTKQNRIDYQIYRRWSTNLEHSTQQSVELCRFSRHEEIFWLFWSTRNAVPCSPRTFTGTRWCSVRHVQNFKT